YCDYHFNKTGVTFTVLSGDNGAKVDWPAACPDVTSVGSNTRTARSYSRRVNPAGAELMKSGPHLWSSSSPQPGGKRRLRKIQTTPLLIACRTMPGTSDCRHS